MDEGETIVSENGAEEDVKMAERTSMFTIALLGRALQKGCGRSTSDETDFENRRIYQKRRHLFPRKTGNHNSIFTP
jgi:hypothetical protein